MYQHTYLRTENWHAGWSKKIATPSQTNPGLLYWACPHCHNSCFCLSPQCTYTVRVRVRVSETTRVGPWTKQDWFLCKKSPHALWKIYAKPPASQDEPSPETRLASTLTWDSSLQLGLGHPFLGFLSGTVGKNPPSNAGDRRRGFDS